MCTTGRLLSQDSAASTLHSSSLPLERDCPTQQTCFRRHIDPLIVITEAGNEPGCLTEGKQ